MTTMQDNGNDDDIFEMDLLKFLETWRKYSYKYRIIIITVKLSRLHLQLNCKVNMNGQYKFNPFGLSLTVKT